MPLDRVVVTGSTGFVGRSLVAQLEGTWMPLHFGADDWKDQLDALDLAGATVLHLAGRAHQAGHADAFHDDNCEKTLALATKAVADGARRIVYLSSIKVNGEETQGRPFQPDDSPAPVDAYGRSKWAAEKALVDTAARAGLDHVIVRAPLIYGAAVRGNLHALLRLSDSRLPLPFGAIENRRSFLHVDDLSRALLACASARQAAGRVYLVAHRNPASTVRLVSLIRERLERPARLVRASPAMLEGMASLFGQAANMRRLTRSLEADPTRAENELQWNAQISLESAVDDMVNAYRAESV